MYYFWFIVILSYPLLPFIIGLIFPVCTFGKNLVTFFMSPHARHVTNKLGVQLKEY